MRISILGAVTAIVALGACSDPVKDAKDRFYMVEANVGNDPAALCRAAAEVREAALQAKNESDYRIWSGIAAGHCALASVQRY